MRFISEYLKEDGKGFTVTSSINLAIKWTRNTKYEGHKGYKGTLIRYCLDNECCVIATSLELMYATKLNKKDPEFFKLRMTGPDINNKMIWAVDYSIYHKKLQFVPIRSLGCNYGRDKEYWNKSIGTKLDELGL